MKSVQKQLARNLLGNLLSALLFVVLGLLLILWPATAVDAVSKLIGILLLIGGLVNLILFFALRERGAEMLFQSILQLVFGILITTRPSLYSNFFPIIMGIFVFLHGLGNIGHVLVLKRGGSCKWLAALIASLLMIILGALIFLHPAFVERSIVVFTGLALLLRGFADIIFFLRTRN